MVARQICGAFSPRPPLAPPLVAFAGNVLIIQYFVCELIKHDEFMKLETKH